MIVNKKFRSAVAQLNREKSAVAQLNRENIYDRKSEKNLEGKLNFKELCFILYLDEIPQSSLSEAV